MTTLFGVGNIAEPVKALLAQFDIDVKALSAQFDSRTAAAMGHRNADAVSVPLAPPPPEPGIADRAGEVQSKHAEVRAAIEADGIADGTDDAAMQQRVEELRGRRLFSDAALNGLFGKARHGGYVRSRSHRIGYEAWRHGGWGIARPTPHQPLFEV